MRPLPSLNALRAFEAIARHQSFAKAAAELNVSATALSHQIRGLEDMLGMKLFERRPRSIALTEAGRLLQPGIAAGFERFREALDRLARIGDDRVLVISATPGFTSKWLVPRLYRFMDAHPEIETRVSATTVFADFVRDGIDVGIRLSPGNHPGLHVEKLADESVLPLCSPRLLAEGSGLATPADLGRMALIHIELPIAAPPPMPSWADWLAAAGLADIDPSHGPRFNMADHALDAAIAGAGVVLAYRIIASGDMRSGLLVSPFGPELPVIGRAYYFVCAPGRERVPKVRAFRDWLAAELAAT